VGTEALLIKIVAAANAMADNPDKINPIVVGREGEYYFLYDGEYKWSLQPDRDGDDWWLYYYPGPEELQSMARMDPIEFDGRVEFVAFSTKELKAKEANDSFRALYNVIKEKQVGVDRILDAVIRGKRLTC
jgi:hypothetical protein